MGSEMCIRDRHCLALRHWLDVLYFGHAVQLVHCPLGRDVFLAFVTDRCGSGFVVNRGDFEFDEPHWRDHVDGLGGQKCHLAA